ncbi:MAG TPA: hypothetical protein VFJ85_04725 [Acidimicrobiales bacterium]|nr:hypothetical protein [Acidimicrobiales bacterium]
MGVVGRGSSEAGESVYFLAWDQAFRPLATEEAAIAEFTALGLARGERLLQEWNAPTVWRSREAEFAGLRDGAFPLLLPGLAVFRSDVARDLAEHVPNAQRLPLVSEDGEDLEILHVSSFVDCLDVHRSTIRRFSSGRVRHIDRAVLDGARVGGPDAIWRIPEAPYLLLVHGEHPTVKTLLGLPGLSLECFGEIV